jgi:hypothetical protein
MQRERYPGEATGLRSFLIGLQPIVAREFGSDCLLLHAIRRALRTGALADLRRARQMFNLLPRERKRAVSSGIVAAERAPDRPPPGGRPGPWVTFDGGASADGRVAPAIGLAEAVDGPEHGLRVLVRPGTLPSVAAGTLRRIAELIEADRRLLSARFWLGAERDVGGEGS